MGDPDTAGGARPRARSDHILEPRGIDPVPCDVWNVGAGTRDIVFLSGFGRAPAHYGELLGRLAEELDARVLAPFLFGNGGRRGTPTSVADCVAQAAACVDTLTRAPLRGGPVLGGGGRDVHLAGHSTGGLVAHAVAGELELPVASVVAVNPPLPVAFGAFGFLVRGLRLGLRHELGRTGDPAETRRLQRAARWSVPRSVLRRPLAHLRLVRALAALSVADFGRPTRGAHGFGAPTRTTLFGAGDEFFALDDAFALELARHFDGHVVERVTSARSHEWLLVETELANRRIGAALLR